MVGLLNACVQNSADGSAIPAMGVNWAVFGLVLALLVVFGAWFGWLTRWLALHQVEGQTAYMVVVGTFVTLIGFGLVAGWQAAALAFACFAASGLPMVLEYVSRIHALRKHDQETADKLAKELLR